MDKKHIGDYSWFDRHPRDRSHIALSYLTHFYVTGDSISPVTDMLERYAAYDGRLLDRIHFVIVDDGSPLEYEVPKLGLNITWLKIRENIPWNNPGARNLAAVYARSDKIILTDLDHEFPETTFEHLVKRRQCGRDFFKFHRKDPETNEWIKGHPNNFLMSRARFFRFFGYDEEFAGGHGSDDFRFVKHHKYHGSRQRYLPRKCYSMQRTDIEASHHNLDRGVERNTPIDRRKRAEVLFYGGEHGHSRMNLNFHWDILDEQFRTIEWEPPRKRAWIYRWHLRFLFGYK